MKRPILYCAISFCLGISLTYFFNIPIKPCLIVALILIILAAIFFKNNRLSHIFLYIALILFGAVYYQNFNILSPNHIANFTTEEGRKVLLKGRIANDPVTKKAFYGKEKISFTLKADAISLMNSSPGLKLSETVRQAGAGSDYYWQKVTGLVKVDLYSGEKQDNINFGDEIVAKGLLSRPQGLKNPGIFDYSNYLKIKNIYALFTVNGIDSVRVIRNGQAGRMQIWAYVLRRRINDAITRYVDASYSGFLKAILTGERGELEVSVTDDFIKTGTVHVIAISGLNIALIAGIFIFVFRIFGIRKKFNLILTSAALIFYCFVAGANPPVVRATIMFVIVCLGYLIDRESDILNSLAIAAFIILLGNPNELFDPSFQLSFASIFGIVLFSPRVGNLFSSKPNYFIKGMALSIAAIIAVSPIVGRYFNIVSPIAIIANLVIVPALFVITIGSFIFLIINFLGLKFILIYAGWALSLLTKATFYINHLFAQIPLSYIRIPSPSISFLLLYYVFIFSFFFFKRKRELIIILLLVINLAVWSNLFAEQNKKLKITFLDVGKGDSILLEFPDKGAMLIDGGSGGIEGMTDTGRSVVAPILWNKGIRRLDAVIVTHFHEDHMGGVLYLLKNFDIGCVMDNDTAPPEDRRLYNEYKDIVMKKGIRRLVIADRDEITGFDRVRLYVINPPQGQGLSDANNNSVVIKLDYKKFGALFCGDISSNAMERIMSYGELLKSDVLKVPHHGGSMGKESVAHRFFDEVSPRVSVISSGGRFHSRDLSEISTFFTSVNYNTKLNGAINITTDGSDFEARPFCPKN